MWPLPKLKQERRRTKRTTTMIGFARRKNMSFGCTTTIYFCVRILVFDSVRSAVRSSTAIQMNRCNNTSP